MQRTADTAHFQASKISLVWMHTPAVDSRASAGPGSTCPGVYSKRLKEKSHPAAEYRAQVEEHETVHYNP